MFQRTIFYYYQQVQPAWGGEYTGFKVHVVFEEKVRMEGWKEGLGVEASSKHSADALLGTGRGIMASNHPVPIRLRNSWNSSCPLQLMSNFFIRQSRTPASFRFFVKAAQSCIQEG